MTHLIYIYENESGATCLDRYFEYLKSVEDLLSVSLKKFALDKRRYELNDSRTLHDAWLKNISIDKEYEPSTQLVETTVQVELQLADAKTYLKLKYFGVVEIQSQLNPDRWGSRPVDLLVHEISIDDKGLFRHFLMFDRGVYVVIFFREIEVIE